jgi:prepilin-type N-terminal cleavage/methylation domain-containing protein
MFKIFNRRQNTPKPTTRGQNGFTLLELLLVVGVGSLLLIGGIATYRLVTQGNKANDTSKMLITMKQEAQTLFQGSTYPTGSLEPALTASGAWPTGGKTPFNTTVTATGSGSATFSITLAALPQAACIKVIRAVYGTGDEIKIGSDAVTSATAGKIAADTCTAATKDITWTFL